MRIAVLFLALLLSGCANFQLPDWMGGKARASEPRHRAPQPAPREPAVPAPVEAAQPPAQTVPVEPSSLPRKRKYEED
jgi:hypothetical protein